MLYSEQRIRALAFLEEQDRSVQDPVDLGVHQIVSFSLGAIPLSVFSVIFHESRTGWFPHGMRAFFHPGMYSQEGQNLSVKGHNNSLRLDKITISLRPSLGI